MSMIRSILNKFNEEKNRVGLCSLGRKWTYKEIIEESVKVSLYLNRFRLGKGSHIAIQSNNNSFFIFSYLGALMKGYVVTPLPYLATIEEINTILKSCDIELCLVQYKPTNHIENVIFIDEEEISSEQYRAKDIEVAAQSFKEANGNEVALLLPTSGTTGNQKIVMLSYDNVMSNAIAHGKRVGYKRGEKFLVTMPLHFSSAITTQMLSAMLFSTELYLLNLPIHPRLVLENIIKNQINGFSAVPTYLRLLLDEFEKKPGDYLHHNLDYVVISGAPVTETLYERLKLVFPKADILQTYGLTEASPRVAMMGRGEKKLTCGTPVEGVSVRIKSKSQSIGEVLVKGPNVMLGYYKNEELTHKTKIDGWLYTGDLGFLDEAGRLIITGRKKNIIISGGVNIYPEEIESKLSKFTQFEELVVIGMEHDIWGEVPVVIYKAYENKPVQVEFIKKECSKIMPSYMVPNKWIEVCELPKTKTGKIDRSKFSNFSGDIKK